MEMQTQIAGKQVEGKEYVVKDGDVLLFKLNV
jgi:ribosome-binding ATPase YchF (GTP1/OBG family)